MEKIIRKKSKTKLITIPEFIENQLDIQARSFEAVNDVFNKTNSIYDNVSGINGTHQQIKSNE